MTNSPPPEWTRTEVLEFPGSADGPWARYVHDPDTRGVGTLGRRSADCSAALCSADGVATNAFLDRGLIDRSACRMLRSTTLEALLLPGGV